MLRLPILTIIMVLLATFLFFRSSRSALTTPAGPGPSSPGPSSPGPSSPGRVVPKSWLVSNPKPGTPAEHVRPADQTFLTYPEWFLVHSPAEIAHYARTHTTTTFPYMDHVRQLWQSYGIMYDQIKESFPFNTGYHVMIWVIGVSTTVEYALKALYETVIGRLTDPANGAVITEEDAFNARFTQDYVDFIRVRPWYEFDFIGRIPQLLRTSFRGPHFIRKTERKFMLLTELLVKAGYGYLIKLGTKASYDEALPTTAVIIDKLPADGMIAPPVKTYADGSALLLLPRYEAFNPAVAGLVRQGVTFREIAGNNSAILLTLLTPTSWRSTDSTLIPVFTQPIVTRPGQQRVAVVTTVGQLDKAVRFVQTQPVTIEHLYDY